MSAPRLESGQCPICKWWFDGYLIGAHAGRMGVDEGPDPQEPRGSQRHARYTALNRLIHEYEDWAIDARTSGVCTRPGCIRKNRGVPPTLIQPDGLERPQAQAEREGVGSQAAGIRGS